MASRGGWTWLRVMAVVAGAALLVALFLPKSVMPPDRLPYFAAAFTGILGIAGGAEARDRTKGSSHESDKG